MNSIFNKKWVNKEQSLDLNIFQNLLKSRGIIDAEDVQNYLAPSYKKGFHNPFLMKDMEKAVNRIKQAAASGERVIVFGDYDVDGISGTAVLVKALTLYGVNVSYRLPHRVNDGYGLNIKFIDEFIEKGIKLVITVDCGISCKAQIDLAKANNIDVIITDHHTIPEQIPDKAYAILHPLQSDCPYPFKGLTGSGVAYKLATALLTEKFTGEERERLIYSLLDLASLGTVADLGPLLNENRIIVKYGLEALQRTNWQGLKFLMESAGLEPSSKMDISTIGFKIGPRINAAGRIDHPYYALQLLLHEEEGSEGLQKGKALAAHLEKLNTERQKMVIDAMEEAEIRFLEKSASDKIFIAWDKNWHVGILGLIAGKFVEKHAMPCIILQEFEEHLVASFRSTPAFNAVDALNYSKEYLDHYGGHAQAAGFSLKKENLENFVRIINEYAYNVLSDASSEIELHLDAELHEQDITDNFMRMLEQMEPYGIGNHQPVFLLKGVAIEGLKKVGKDLNHLHFKVNTGTRRFPVIGFKMGEYHDLLTKSPLIDLACNLEKNEHLGRVSIQLKAVDIKPVN